MSVKDKEQEVKEVNKKFLDSVADIFEKIDEYRLKELGEQLGDVLKRLSQEAGSSSLLNLGCGTGLSLRAFTP